MIGKAEEGRAAPPREPAGGAAPRRRETGRAGGGCRQGYVRGEAGAPGGDPRGERRQGRRRAGRGAGRRGGRRRGSVDEADGGGAGPVAPAQLAASGGIPFSADNLLGGVPENTAMAEDKLERLKAIRWEPGKGE